MESLPGSTPGITPHETGYRPGWPGYQTKLQHPTMTTTVVSIDPGEGRKCYRKLVPERAFR